MIVLFLVYVPSGERVNAIKGIIVPLFYMEEWMVECVKNE